VETFEASSGRSGIVRSPESRLAAIRFASCIRLGAGEAALRVDAPAGRVGSDRPTLGTLGTLAGTQGVLGTGKGIAA
jgi:hypothetical protein